MKTTKLFLIIFLFGFIQFSNGQFIEKIAKKATKKVEKEAEKRTEKKINKTIDKGFDKVENKIDSIGVDKPNKESNETSNGTTSTNEIKQENPTLTWSKYDFVPGTELIFEDDFSIEQNGEFPSRWDITKGVVEIADLNGERVVWFKKTNANGPDAIMPYLKNRTEDYLPEEFTVEMDVYFHKDYNLNKEYYLFLYDSKNQMKIFSPSKAIRVSYNRIEYNQIGDKYSGQDHLKPKEGWRHVAISFNKRALKGYLDDTRLLNIPNVEFNPTGIMISAHNTSGKGQPFIKNVRIAKGAVPLYDKFLVNGKFVTTGIKFDVNKATLKAESMGTINYVVKMMQEHPELKFNIEGHTDSDGTDVANQSLSEARAKTVLNTMISLGIRKDRLTSKGLGESNPMVNNDTPEGKAQNRRVEFVKF